MLAKSLCNLYNNNIKKKSQHSGDYASDQGTIIAIIKSKANIAGKVGHSSGWCIPDANRNEIKKIV